MGRGCDVGVRPKPSNAHLESVLQTLSEALCFAELLLPRFEVHWNKLVSTEYCLVDEQASIVTGVKLPII